MQSFQAVSLKELSAVEQERKPREASSGEKAAVGGKSKETEEETKGK